MITRNTTFGLAVFVASVILMLGCQATGQSESKINGMKKYSGERKAGENAMKSEVKSAVFGGGCFWCVEAVFERVDGVVDVVSGYAGGQVKNPTYQQVSSGKTGHAEVCRINYDPKTITYDELLDIFFTSHDPTTEDQQGHDVGSQYRSIILYQNEEEKAMAEASIKTWNESGTYPRPIVTKVEPLDTFYPAEEYHQDYFARNPDAPYCVYVIQPKLEKLNKY